MIRFIDLGDQITCDGTKEFAWYDTIKDVFIELCGNQTWDNWEEFEQDLLEEYPGAKNPDNVWTLAEFKQLFQWKDKK